MNSSAAAERVTLEPRPTERRAPHLTCRFCGSQLNSTFADLGMTPLANSYRGPDEVNRMEPFYPLRAYVCDHCYLVQLDEFESPEAIFCAEYAYFSSFSESWLAHARKYVDDVTKRFALGAQSKVIEVACNDGYLLRWFKPKGVPVLGIEPAHGCAEKARELGIDVVPRFFGRQLAQELLEAGHAADLMVANNVVAHVPALNDFVAGFKILLKPAGVVTFEFHHVMNLIQRKQFDTIYHEHFCYHSLSTFRRILAHHGLEVFDVEELVSHGGSLRIYAQHRGSGVHAISMRVGELVAREDAFGINSIQTYLDFSERIKSTKRRFLSFLIDAKAAGKSVAAYGAPAKGNTFLNYAGARCDFIDYTVDLNPHKQGRFLPGTLIPIHAPEHIFETRPDYVLILPWNLRDEIVRQMSGIRQWGGKFVVAIPELEVL